MADLNTPIIEMAMSVRLYNILKFHEVDTLGKLAGKTKGEILKMRGLGKLTLKEIQDILATHGLELAGTPKRCPNCGKVL